MVARTAGVERVFCHCGASCESSRELPGKVDLIGRDSGEGGSRCSERTSEDGCLRPANRRSVPWLLEGIHRYRTGRGRGMKRRHVKPA